MVDLYSLTKTEAKVYEALTGSDFVSDEQMLMAVQGFSESLATAVVKNRETRAHTMAVRRLEKKTGLNIERVRGRGFRLLSNN